MSVYIVVAIKPTKGKFSGRWRIMLENSYGAKCVVAFTTGTARAKSLGDVGHALGWPPGDLLAPVGNRIGWDGNTFYHPDRHPALVASIPAADEACYNAQTRLYGVDPCHAVPVCDCGAKVAKTPCARWCSKGNQ